MKKTIPVLITAIGGLLLIVAYFVPPMQSWSDEASAWFSILAGFAFVLGGGNLLKLNLKKVSDRARGWGYAAVTLAAFLITLIVGICKIGVAPSEQATSLSWSGMFDAEGGAFWLIYTYVVTPLQGTMFALLAFYVSSAAFRAFRAKNLEATLLLGTAFIVLLGRTYLGVVMTDWVPGVVDWFAAMLPASLAPPAHWRTNDPANPLTLPGLASVAIDVFNASGQRAIKIGMALGIVATSLKIILGIDRSYLGGGGD